MKARRSQLCSHNYIVLQIYHVSFNVSEKGYDIIRHQEIIVTDSQMLDLFGELKDIGYRVLIER